METTGNRIRKKRKERGLNQEELALKVNKSKQVVSNWERGYSKPVDDDLLSLTEALEVSSDYLLGREAKKEVHREETEELKKIREAKERMKKTIDDHNITNEEAARVLEKYHSNLFKE